MKQLSFILDSDNYGFKLRMCDSKRFKMFWYFTIEQETKETYKWQLSTGKWKDWTLKLFAGKETQDKNKLHYLVGIYRSVTSTVRGCFFLLLHVFSHESYDMIPLSDYRTSNISVDNTLVCDFLEFAIVKQSWINSLKV